jgi:hypothetical protein
MITVLAAMRDYTVHGDTSAFREIIQQRRIYTQELAYKVCKLDLKKAKVNPWHVYTNVICPGLVRRKTQ